MKGLVAIMAACMSAGLADAQTKTAAQIIAEHKIPISRTSPASYQGPGWDRLVNDGARAQFFMIGEQHGVADIAQFVTALHSALAAKGYTHSALEVGPYSTAFAESLVRRGPGALGSYIAQPGHGFTIPFLFFGEEITLTEQIVARSPDKKEALWGLDQEFVGATPIAVELLRRRARTPGQHAAVDAFQSRSASDRMLVAALGAAELDPLMAAFGGDTEAEELIEALKFSAEVYAPFLKKSGPIQPANHARETYMKRNFARAFAKAERRLDKPPKVFMKFGGYHAMRGISGTDVPALANFLAEWGIPRGFDMVNMMVDCTGGEMLNPASGKPAPCSPYFGPDTVIGGLAKDDVTLIDLRPLRTKFKAMPDLDAKTRQAILAFDYYMIIRNPKAATPVGTPAGE